MTKLKSFFSQYINSLWPSNLYKEVGTKNFGHALKYFALIALVASVVSGISAAFRIAPEAKTGALEILKQVKDIYPQDLILSSKDNAWTINQPEPYVIPLPDMGMPADTGDKLPKNLVVFDHNGTIDDFAKLDTFVLINSVNIVAIDNNQIKAVPIKDVPDGELTKDEFIKLITPFEGYVKFVAPAVTIAALVGSFFYFFGYRLGYLLFAALVLWPISALTKHKLTYSQAYKLSMYTISLPLTLQTLMIALNLSARLPYWFLLTHVALGIAVLIKLSQNVAKAATIPNTPAQQP